MLLILSSSFIPMDREVDGLGFAVRIGPTLQNFLHAPVFGFLSILWMQILRSSSMEVSKRILLVLAIGTGFGGVNELIQMLIPGRCLSLLDVGIDMLGVVVGIVGFQWNAKRARLIGPGDMV